MTLKRSTSFFSAAFVTLLVFLACIVGVAGIAPVNAYADEATGLAAGSSAQLTAPRNESVYYVYNPKTNDRVYTTSIIERDSLKRAGWKGGSAAWTAPADRGTSVFCLYKAGQGHVYTTSGSERNKLVASGWKNQGVAFRIPNSTEPRVGLYCDYNPKATKFNYMITTSTTTHDANVKKGWKLKRLLYAVPSASQMRNGWLNVNNSWQYNKNGQAVSGKWLVTKNHVPTSTLTGKQRYWLDAQGKLAQGRLVNPKSALDKKAKYYAYARKSGDIVCGKYKLSKTRTYVADKNGKLPSKGGWLVTKKYDGTSQRYYIDSKTHAAKTGVFKVAKKLYSGIAGKGYVVRNSYAEYKKAWYKANNNGVLKKDSKITRMAKKAQKYASDTKYLIMIDVDNPVFILFTGKKGAWKIKNVWECDTGAPETPTIVGVYKMGIKGYSFGHGYTCYYYSQILGDYLIHTRLYVEGTWILNDGPLGRRCSQGCVRLATPNAKWVWDHVPSGTTIVTTY